jgi:hypothetical protein
VEEHLSTTNKTLDSLPCKNQKTKKDKTLLGQTLVEAPAELPCMVALALVLETERPELAGRAPRWRESIKAG